MVLLYITIQMNGNIDINTTIDSWIIIINQLSGSNDNCLISKYGLLEKLLCVTSNIPAPLADILRDGPPLRGVSSVNS